MRHGRTDWSLDRVFQGPEDLPLNTFGVQDAESAANTLCTIVNAEDIVISSELIRAFQTAITCGMIYAGL